MYVYMYSHVVSMHAIGNCQLSRLFANHTHEALRQMDRRYYTQCIVSLEKLICRGAVVIGGARYFPIELSLVLSQRIKTYRVSVISDESGALAVYRTAVWHVLVTSSVDDALLPEIALKRTCPSARLVRV